MPFIRDTLNQWGRRGGENPQRNDLWQVDLSSVVVGINLAFETEFRIVPKWYPASIRIPEPKVKAEATRRDSRSYMMPSWDEPFDPIMLNFLVDDGGYRTKQNTAVTPYSEIYAILDAWRRMVRSGRGSVGAETEPLRLNENYQQPFLFPIYLWTARGVRPVNALAAAYSRAAATSPLGDPATMFPGSTSAAIANKYATLSTDKFSASMQRAMETSGIYILESCWLGGFKLAELSYRGSDVLTCEATIHTANVLQQIP